MLTLSMRDIGSLTAFHAGSDSEGDEVPEDESDEMLSLTAVDPGLNGSQPVIRPGIVHRLDKGTTGELIQCLGSNQYLPQLLYSLHLRIQVWSMQAFWWSQRTTSPMPTSAASSRNIR